MNAYRPNHLHYFHLFAHISLPLERQPEVDQLEILRTAGGQQKILRFDVAVSHFLGVAILDCNHHLLEEMPGLPLGDTSLFDEVVEELVSRADAEWGKWYSMTMWKNWSSSKVSKILMMLGWSSKINIYT